LPDPFIYDSGTGPRVVDIIAFLASSFAAPPSLAQPLCAAFAQQEMREILSTVLPEETALILWYNKSREYARVCPACRRIYRLGDVLPEHRFGRDMQDERLQPTADMCKSPLLRREQELSGLCSPLCFIVAAYAYPGAAGIIRAAWGHIAEEMDTAAWDALDTEPTRPDSAGLCSLLKMTRCSDLGLSEIFPEDDDDDDD
ncbi:hypothetical protein WOLCODRAFT_47734, partial [Wolfiporia cocos MD-104 SS10]